MTLNRHLLTVHTLYWITKKLKHLP